jgi:hypothetical protein
MTTGGWRERIAGRMARLELYMRPVGLIFGISFAWLGVVLPIVAAKAAELPTTRSAPQKHAKTCNVDGMAGYSVPGSTFCVRLGGYISGGVAAGNVK